MTQMSWPSHGCAVLATAAFVGIAAASAEASVSTASSDSPAVGPGSKAFEAAHYELGYACRELPGCRCSGEWEDFRSLLNFTLSHASKAAGPFGARERLVQQLCERHAGPLSRQSLGGDLLQAARRARDELARPSKLYGTESIFYGLHSCPAGLVAALTLCAAVHAEMSRATLLDESEVEPTGDMDWSASYHTWPELLPADCIQKSSCLAYLEALLAVMALSHCAHCLEDSLWPLDAAEVNDNAFRWLRWLRLLGPQHPPPRWKGPHISAHLRPLRSLEAAGAFAGLARGAAGDLTSASSLLDSVARSWSPAPAPGRELEKWRASLPPRQRHFEAIFGRLRRPWEIGARGPLGIHVQVHRDDFTGPRSGLRFYVYELPPAMHSDPLVQLHGRVREAVATPSNCDFALSPCTELRSGGGAFSGYRPYAAEATFLAKLLAAPDGVIVDKPEEATFFVVPFLSSTWCFLGAPKCWVRCAGLRPLNSLLPLLTYFNASTAHRHIFLASDSTGDLPQDIQMQPLTLSYGPTACGPGSGPLITPAPVTDDLPVPGPLEFGSKDLLVFAADGVGKRPFRREAVEELERWQRVRPELFVVARRDRGGRNVSSPSSCPAPPPPAPPTPAEWAHELRRALFCPVLPGDNTFRMRLFHAVLAGCIPVVILFPGGSWYRNHGPPVEWSLPFAGQGVDWRGFAVELPHDPAQEAFGAWAKRLVPSLLRLSVDEIRSRQQKLAAAVPLLRFDFRGERPDAFTGLLDELSRRAASPPPESIECFDPRERFATERCVSGAQSVELEEREIYGVVACCPLPAKKVGEAGGQPGADLSAATGRGQQQPSCDLHTPGRCMSFVTASSEENASAEMRETSAGSAQQGSEERAARRANMRAHLQAMFARKERFTEVLPEDRTCLASLVL